MAELVRIANDSGVLCITMNRPEKKNALTTEMYAAMTAALEEAATSNDIRAVLITGTGDSYTAGNDIAGFQKSVIPLRARWDSATGCCGCKSRSSQQ